ncbi:MAG: hypothetical protein LBE62_11770 [Azonexus sp.]|jgi:hypothetical protein|nr:hypothetical protein [Azonexus sp.]
MPLGDIAGEVLGGIFRFVGRALFEIVGEIVIKGAGYVLIRIFKPKSEPDELACAIVGLLFWAAVGVGAYFVYRSTMA